MHLFKDAPIPANDILSQIQLPVFVKPNNGGSSIGMSKVTEAAQLEGAIQKAFNEDEQVRSSAIKAYNVLNCRGVVRIDFIYNEEKGVPYMLEINTVPGQSAASIVPQQVKAMGWSLQDFTQPWLKNVSNYLLSKNISISKAESAMTTSMFTQRGLCVIKLNTY